MTVDLASPETGISQEVMEKILSDANRYFFSKTHPDKAGTVEELTKHYEQFSGKQPIRVCEYIVEE